MIAVCFQGYANPDFFEKFYIQEFAQKFCVEFLFESDGRPIQSLAYAVASVPSHFHQDFIGFVPKVGRDIFSPAGYGRKHIEQVSFIVFQREAVSRKMTFLQIDPGIGHNLAPVFGSEAFPSLLEPLSEMGLFSSYEICFTYRFHVVGRQKFEPVILQVIFKDRDSRIAQTLPHEVKGVYVYPEAV